MPLTLSPAELEIRYERARELAVAFEDMGYVRSGYSDDPQDWSYIRIILGHKIDDTHSVQVIIRSSTDEDKRPKTNIVSVFLQHQPYLSNIDHVRVSGARLRYPREVQFLLKLMQLPLRERHP